MSAKLIRTTNNTTSMELYKQLHSLHGDVQEFKVLIADKATLYSAFAIMVRLRWIGPDYTYMDVTTGLISEFSIHETDYAFIKYADLGDKNRQIVCITRCNDMNTAVCFARGAVSKFFESYPPSQYECEIAKLPPKKTIITAFALNWDKMPSLETLALHASTQLVYRPHQLHTIDKTVELLTQNETVNVVWGHIPRSGKSYMMSGIVDQLDMGQGNCLIVTTAPNETIEQYRRIFATHLTKGYSLVFNKEQLQRMKKKSIIMLSKQMLTHVSNSGLVIDDVRLIIIDEAHYGGVTKKAVSMLARYPDVSKIFVTATYSKVLKNMKIDMVMDWSLEDIQLSKDRSISELAKRHEGFDSSITKWHSMYGANCDPLFCYESFPDIKLIELPIDAKGLFGVDEFGDMMELEHINELMGTIINETIPRIDDHNKSIGQRLILSDRDPSVIMCFIPWDKIRDLTNSLADVIDAISNDFVICRCNTMVENPINIKRNIHMGMSRAKIEKKKAVFAISGSQGHLGVTIDRCDLVIMMNNISSKDFIAQAMFRCMTEYDNKQNGYVIVPDYKKMITALGYTCDRLL